MRDDLDSRKSSLSAAKQALLHKRLTQAELSSGPSIAKRPPSDNAPLSFAQLRLWFLHQLDPQSRAYNEGAALRVIGALDVAAFQRALMDVARRHEVLRSTFRIVDGEPRQIISPEPHPEMIAPLADLRSRPRADRDAEVARQMELEAARRFDLEHGPPLRTTILQIDDAEFVVIHTTHHIVSDGWSVGLFIREAGELYDAHRFNRPARLPELPIQYADFAEWQREWLQGELMQREIDYWKQQLAGAPPVLELLSDRPRPPVQRGIGSRHPLALSSAALNGLVDLGRREDSTLFMTLLVAFTVLLHRSTDREDLVIGSPTAGRIRPETEALIGFFVNTLVFRTDVSGDPSFRELLRRVRELARGVLAHQDVPFERIVEALNPPRSLNRNPLFQVMFVLENFPVVRDAAPGMTFEWLATRATTTKVDLTLILRESRGGLAGDLEYDAELFEAASIARLAEQFQGIVDWVLANPDRPLSDLDLSSRAERAQCFGARTASDSPSAITRLFEAQVERRPEAIAVAHGSEHLTYDALNRRANQLARVLRARGVVAGTIVAVLLEPSIDAVVTFWAVLKAAGVYVPIDRAYPAERIAALIDDARPTVMMADASRYQSLSRGLPIVSAHDGASLEDANLDIDVDARSAAYLMFTSGSTGTPKGVVVTHDALAQHCVTVAHVYALTPADRVLQFASLSFDPSLEQICAPLISGACVVMRRRDVLDPWQFYVDLCDDGVTVMNPPTAWWRQLLVEWSRARQPPAAGPLRLVVVSGEAMLPEDVRLWFSMPLSAARLINAYGPTEATIHATMFDVTPECAERARLPIGRPLAGRSAYVLDRRGHMAAMGSPGELYLGGAGVAREYLNSPELTAERFVPDPFANAGVMYRTGDRARYLADGTIEFLGRVDDQVKVRGYRVELGDIEAALRRHPAVRQAAVLAHDEASGDRHLVAYLVPAEDAGPTAADLRAFLRARVPEYMVPQVFVTIDALPVNATGKVDRSRLPDPVTAATHASDITAPRNEAEELLAVIWSDVLGVPRIGIHTDFFDMGGHSLSAIRVTSRARDAFATDIPVRWLFEHPTIAALADRIVAELRTRRGLRTPPIVPRPDHGWSALSLAQEEFWAFDHATPGAQMFNVHSAVRVRGAVDEVALTNAIAHVIARHEALRTTFPLVDGRAVQQVAAPERFTLDAYDLRDVPAAERAGTLAVLASQVRYHRFDLQRPPCLYAALVRLDDNDSVILLTVHHIVFDGWSQDIVRRELTEIYTALVRARTPVLPALHVQYRDFAVWQREVLRGEYLEALLTYWRGVLAADLVPLRLPADRERPAARTFIYGRCARTLSDDLYGRLGTVGQRADATVFMTLTAVIQALLRRLSGQDDIRIATMSAGRTRPEVEHVVGLFTNTLVLRTDVGGDPTFVDLLGRVRAAVLGAIEHEDLPFQTLLHDLVHERHIERRNLVPVLFVFEHAAPGVEGAAGLSSAPMPPSTEDREAIFSTFDLIIEVSEGPPVSVLLKYDADVYDAQTGERILRQFVDVLEQVAAHPDRRLSALGVTPLT